MILLGSSQGSPITSDEAEYAHDEKRHSEQESGGVSWAGLTGAVGNGPHDSEEVAPTLAEVANDTVDLRAGPGTVYDTITRLFQGDSTRVQLRHEGWLKVAAVDGTEGWLGKNQVTFTQGTAEDVPVASYIPPPPVVPAPPDESVTDAPGDESPPVEVVVEVPAAEEEPEEEPPVEEPAAPGTVEQEPAPEVLPKPETVSPTPSAAKPHRPTPAPAKPSPAPAKPSPAKPSPVVRAPNKPAPNKPSPTPAQPAAAKPAPPVQPAAKPAAPAPVVKPRWVWPARGTVTSGFGYRNLGGRHFHNGIDIANDKGTPIVAAREGTVSEAGWCSGYGYCVKIRHAGGFASEYGHLAAKPPVRVGQVVAAGTLIGSMGTTYDRDGGGYSTGVHLHFTLRLNGRAVDPRTYLP